MFSVEGVTIGAFQEVSGLSVDVKVEGIKEGGQNHFEHKVPGRMEWPNLVLKRGITTDNNLFIWFHMTSGEGFAESTQLYRTTAALSLLDADGETVLRTWNFEGAFPVKWKGPSFSASSSDVATEELEIVHHGFRVE
jgi:phage tail-like protein